MLNASEWWHTRAASATGENGDDPLSAAHRAVVNGELYVWDFVILAVGSLLLFATVMTAMRGTATAVRHGWRAWSALLDFLYKLYNLFWRCVGTLFKIALLVALFAILFTYYADDAQKQAVASAVREAAPHAHGIWNHTSTALVRSDFARQARLWMERMK